MSEQFLKDNRFSVDASSAPGVYIKDLSKEIKAPGDLHAHLKLTFAGGALTNCSVHATIRTSDDTDTLGKGRITGNALTRTVGRAIWIYDDGTYRSPVKQSWWLENGGITYSQLKSYCRKLVKSVKNWQYELEKEGITITARNPAMATAMIDAIGTGE